MKLLKRHKKFPPGGQADEAAAAQVAHPAVAIGAVDETAPSPRLPAIDIARGLALIAMASYHGAWDLANVRLVDWGVATDPLWRASAMLIAASFLFLSGVSMQLSRRGGFDPARFVLRLIRIAVAALLVSLATYAVFPESWVYFGILHMMVVGGLVTAPLQRLHPLLLVLLAACALALPHYARSDVFDGLPLAITGLAVEVPAANDFVPIFPWLAPMLLGLAAGRPIAAAAARWSAPLRGRLWRGLGFLGRWSLVFYLVHQPVLFGVAEGLAMVLPVDPAVERQLFLGDCQTECQRFGANEGQCRAFCGCVAESIDGTPVWQSRTIDSSYDGLISTAASACRGAPDGFDTDSPSADKPEPDDDD